MVDIILSFPCWLAGLLSLESFQTYFLWVPPVPIVPIFFVGSRHASTSTLKSFKL
jgi:hypothetical protein